MENGAFSGALALSPLTKSHIMLTQSLDNTLVPNNKSKYSFFFTPQIMLHIHIGHNSNFRFWICSKCPSHLFTFMMWNTFSICFSIHKYKTTNILHWLLLAALWIYILVTIPRLEFAFSSILIHTSTLDALK